MAAREWNGGKARPTYVGTTCWGSRSDSEFDQSTAKNMSPPLSNLHPPVPPLSHTPHLDSTAFKADPSMQKMGESLAL
jgi:hypothetical protein